MLSRLFFTLILIIAVDIYSFTFASDLLSSNFALSSAEAALVLIFEVVLSGILGVKLSKKESWSLLHKAQETLAHRQDPKVISTLAEGLLIAMGGLALMLPGLFSDFLGLLILIPPVRQFLVKGAEGRLSANMGQAQHQDAYYQSNFQRIDISKTNTNHDIINGVRSDIIDIQATDHNKEQK